MSIDKDLDEALIVYQGFSTAMKTWNDRFHPLMSIDAAANIAEATSTLTSIFGTYVWPDAKRGAERPNAPSTSHPSDYDPRSDEITSAERLGAKAFVQIQSTTGFMSTYRYTLTRRDKRWAISRRDVLKPTSGKWQIHHI